MADVGVETTDKLLSILQSTLKSDASLDDVRTALKKEFIRRLGESSLQEQSEGPLVILVVKCSGKTTTIKVVSVQTRRKKFGGIGYYRQAQWHN